jgi:hypothetical protein
VDGIRLKVAGKQRPIYALSIGSFAPNGRLRLVCAANKRASEQKKADRLRQIKFFAKNKSVPFFPLLIY